MHDQAARSSPFEGFWGFIPLPRTTRILLIAVIGCSLVVEGVLRVTGAVSGGVPEFASSVATNAALLLLVWRPPVAAGALLLAGLVALAFGQGAP